MLSQINRDHYLIAGIVLLLLGLQFRYVQSFTLTQESARFIQKRLGGTDTSDAVTAILDVTGTPEPRRKIQPPRWLGFSLISVGAVLALQSLAMKKPG